MPSGAWIRTIVALAAGLMIVLSWLTGESIDEQGLRWIGGVAGGVTLLLLAFDAWGWRLPGIRRLSTLKGPPVLHGTWRGVLEYESNELGGPGTTEVYMAIKQTFSSLAVRSYFPRTDSVSWSLTASLAEGSHHYDFYFIYTSRAAPTDQDTNRPHEGTCNLRVVGRWPVEELAGTYYTDRRGRGKIRLHGYSKKVAGSRERAQALDFGELPAHPSGSPFEAVRHMFRRG
jgi:hypothetical protein